MKKFILTLVAASGFIVPVFAADPAPPLVKVVVKKHLMDSDRDKGKTFGGQVTKAYTLRVEVTNTGNTTLAGASLAGTALVHRASATNDRISSEPLTALEVPDLKPNDTATLDLGSIQLHKVVMRQRQMEETLDEWQVICTKGETELGKAETSHYEALSKEAAGRPGKGGRKKRK